MNESDKQIKVSVIIPVYNVEKLIMRCIDSVLSQTFTDFELILVDDGSTDSSGNICDEYALKDQRIKVYHRMNGGVSSARNYGIDVSCGDYLLFIDSDDYVDLDFIETLWINKSDLTLSGVISCDQNGSTLNTQKLKDIVYHSKEDIDYAYLCKYLYSAYCKLFRRNIIIENNVRFPLEYSWGEDSVFVAQYMQYVDSVCALSYTGYYYVHYNNNGTLSSRIRCDIVDEITKSREQVISYLSTQAKDKTEQVSAIIINDIKTNCYYFLYQLFVNTQMSYREKNKVMRHFLKNHYIQLVISEKDTYFRSKIVKKSLDSKNPVRKYYLLRQIKQIKTMIRKLIKLS